MTSNQVERRKQPTTDVVTPPHDLRSWLKQLNFFDILTNHSHSQDFNGARAEYISIRIKILAAVMAVLVLLWIPLDYLLLPEGMPDTLATMRIALSSALILVILYSRRRQRNLPNARRSLLLFISMPALFYATAHGHLFTLNEDAYLLGYSFFPFLLVSLLSIFPLTLTESTILGCVVLLTMVLIKSFTGQLLTLNCFKEMWLASLLLVIALWANQAQLHMLLRLYRQATHDPLTGLFNRGGMRNRLQPLLDHHQKHDLPLTSLMLDLDRFKRINDQYGHLVGDSVLRAFADILRHELRSSDIIARYGGEEFIAILPGSNRQQAMQVAERIRKRCTAITVMTEEDEAIRFSTSIGVTQLRANESLNDMLVRVDNSLYEAKKQGRNRVVSA